MTSAIRTQISHLIASITALEIQLKPLAEHYAQRVRSHSSNDVADHSRSYWEALSTYDSLTRLRNFIANNFIVIETLGVLSLARYTFEMVVQLKRIDSDPLFALVYAREVIEQQVEHHRKMAEHLQHEIALYRQLAERESARHGQILAGAASPAEGSSKVNARQRIAEKMRAASAEIDEELALSLTLYSEDAKLYGFAFQAHRLETQALPQLLAVATQNSQSLADFKRTWGGALADPKYQVNKWSKRAEQVGMKSEYDFIYSYTSRLLHATPVSISTNQQSLEDGELLLFFKYVHAEFVWIVRRATEGKASTHLH